MKLPLVVSFTAKEEKMKKIIFPPHASRWTTGLSILLVVLEAWLFLFSCLELPLFFVAGAMGGNVFFIVFVFWPRAKKHEFHPSFSLVDVHGLNVNIRKRRFPW